MKGVSIFLACKSRCLSLTARRAASFPFSRPAARVFSGSKDPFSGANLVVRSTDQVVVDDDTLEKEKILFRMKRDMANHYAKHEYEKALLAAVEMQDKAEELYGSTNPVFASCLSNTALMQKLTQFYDVAMDNYTKALHIYEDLPTHGKKSSQYLTTLTNLGSLYRELAMQKTGVEKHELLQRAVEALTEVCDTRVAIQGTHHRETITAQLHLATLHRVQHQEAKALDLLNLLLPRAVTIVGDKDLLVATVWNNMGMTHKQRGDFGPAMDCYQRAHFIRSASLGDEHPESIVCLHNQAECLRAQGKEIEAEDLQHRILRIMEKHHPNTLEEVEMEMDAANAAPMYSLPESVQSHTRARATDHTAERDVSSATRRKRE